MVLASMAGVLAVSALVLQLLRGESRTIQPLELLHPFLLITLPVLAITAAAAVLFEATPLLRKGLGIVVWFFVWIVAAIGGQSPGAPLGGIGVTWSVRSMGTDIVAQHGDSGTVDFGLGLMYLDTPLRTFTWSGVDISAGYVTSRAALVVVALALAAPPTLWFRRFDPARPTVVVNTFGASGPRKCSQRKGPAPGLVTGELMILVQRVSR